MESFFTHSRSRIPRLAWWWALLPILLGVAVFAWGLQYKLSLYDPPQSECRMPAAKLLSKNELPPVATFSAGALGRSQNAIAPQRLHSGACILLAALVLGVRFSTAYEHRTRALLPLRSVDIDAFLVRPPPAV